MATIRLIDAPIHSLVRFEDGEGIVATRQIQDISAYGYSGKAWRVVFYGAREPDMLVGADFMVETVGD